MCIRDSYTSVIEKVINNPSQFKTIVEKNAQLASANICLAEFHKSLRKISEKYFIAANNYISKFGFERDRLPNDLSLALGSGNFSPAEVARSYGVLANDGYLVDLHYVSKILDRNGNNIFVHQDTNKSAQEDVTANMTAFPWLNTLELEAKKPYNLLSNVSNKNKVIDERVTHIVKDILKEHTRRGSTGRKTAILKRADIAGKTGTTNDAKSTWFSGFHEDLVTVSYTHLTLPTILRV